MTRQETTLGNARIVLADRVIERGWVAFADGRIAEFGEGEAPGRAEDAAGDLIMPGLIELHTDHLEAHYVPRPKVFWDPVAAVVSYDGHLATSGITTVFDSLRVWREDGAEEVDGRAGILAKAIHTAREENLLRADPDLAVGDNEPYDGALKGDTMYRHCMITGIPHALLEVRQDLIGDETGISAWAERLAPIFAAMNADPALHEYDVHLSRTGPY